MDTYGTIIFRANDASDIFLKILVQENDEDLSDESLFGVQDAQFSSNRPWVTGNVPRFQHVQVDGDTAVIHAWFKSQEFIAPFEIRIYVEYEMAEELVVVEADEEVADEDKKTDLEPQEIHL